MLMSQQVMAGKKEKLSWTLARSVTTSTIEGRKPEQTKHFNFLQKSLFLKDASSSSKVPFKIVPVTSTWNSEFISLHFVLVRCQLITEFLKTTFAAAHQFLVAILQIKDPYIPIQVGYDASLATYLHVFNLQISQISDGIFFREAIRHVCSSDHSCFQLFNLFQWILAFFQGKLIYLVLLYSVAAIYFLVNFAMFLVI